MKKVWRKLESNPGPLSHQEALLTQRKPLKPTSLHLHLKHSNAYSFLVLWDLVPIVPYQLMPERSKHLDIAGINPHEFPQNLSDKQTFSMTNEHSIINFSSI